MNSTSSPRREHSPIRSKTSFSLTHKSPQKPPVIRSISSQSCYASPTQATKPHRYNKLYRCPPTPAAEVQYDREKSFILDCEAVSSISADYSTANPKLGSVIPPYIAQQDRHVDSYFKFFGLRDTLKKTGQYSHIESPVGKIHDRFYTNGHSFRYLSARNKFGSGRSVEEIRGHDLFLNDPKPIVNYNGLFGYRRNTPALRNQPIIGVRKLEGNGYIPLGPYSTFGSGKSTAFHCTCNIYQQCRCHNQNKLCPCVKA